MSFFVKGISIMLSTTVLGVTGITATSQVAQASANTTSVAAASSKSGTLNDLINQLWPDGPSTNQAEDYDTQLDVSKLSSTQLNEMNQMIVDHAIIKQSGSDTDITIMDSTIAGAYDSALSDRPFSENRSYSGKTHIKFHGALKKGNMDIYIGKDMLTLMHAGLGAKGLVMIIVKAAGDDYIGAAKSLASAIQQTVKAGNVKTGVHFTIRHWTSIKKS